MTARTAGSLSEDWWALILGLAIIAAAVGACFAGFNLNDLISAPAVWDGLSDGWGQAIHDLLRYVGFGLVLLVCLTAAAANIGYRPSRFAASFTVVYVLSILILFASAWRNSRQLYVETPLIALVLGLILANVAKLPSWMETGLRAEFYLKIGVVLLGASLPLPIIMQAGPVALAQASIGSVVTFAVIYTTARFLKLERRLSALLAGGGSICGISAIVAIAGAVRAKREDISVATTMVVGWALVMIVVLPLLAWAWWLPSGVGGAWIGTSEYADAAGYAAAQTFGRIAISGAPEQSLQAYTLVKIIGRDMWIGVWAAGLSLVSLLRWEPSETRHGADLSQIWVRFPKFILGFFLASAAITIASRWFPGTSFGALRPGLLAPVEAMRNWLFTFSFLSIGTSLRIRTLAPVTGNAFVAFSAGVAVNLILGYILSAVVFASYWTTLGR
jgi:uncharacterized membrane protein YadS